jgi:UDP-N-acetyl-2-amino-2-deoxyglucuronate dehydrogenase
VPARHRIAIIGLGMALKPHLKSLEDLADRVEISGCYTPNLARRQTFAAAHAYPVFDDLDRILGDRTIDAVVVLTPPNTHLDIVTRCAEFNKHVLLEKPMEVSAERGRRVIAAMERSGCKLGIVLQHRFRAVSRRLALLITEGKLGRLLSGSAAIRWWRPPEYFAQPGRGMKERDGGGVLLTQAIHTLDLFQSLAGPIAAVTAFAATSPLRAIDTEDVVGAGIVFADGAVGTIDATTVAYPGFPERIELACEKATAVLNAETLDVFFKDGRHLRESGTESNSGGADPMAFSHEAHKALITDFLDALDENRLPAVHGREALKVQLLIEALLRSAAERCAAKVA